jgi:hypothetical protein
MPDRVRGLAIRAFVGLAAVFLLASCGGAAGNEKARKVSSQGGASTYEIRSAHVSVAVPRDWETLTADQAVSGGAWDAFVADNPDFAPYRDLITKADSPVKFIAVAPKDEQGFGTNLNIIVSPVPREVGFDEYAKANMQQLAAMGSVARDSVEQELVTLPAGRAQKVSYRLSVVAAGKRRTVATLQYALLVDGKSYVLTYTTLPGEQGRWADVFRRSAESFRLL